MQDKASYAIFCTSLLMITMCSCGTDRKLMATYKKSKVFDSMATMLDVNHTYSNISTDQPGALAPEVIYSFHEPWSSLKIRDSGSVALKYDGGESLLIHFESADTVFDYRLKVKNKGNYLVLKRHLVIIPIPLLSFYDKQKQILFSDAHGQLISISFWKRMVWVLIPYTNSYTMCHRFSRTQ